MDNDNMVTAPGVTPKTKTTMAIDLVILEKLRSFKVHPRETDNECLGRVLDMVSEE